LEVRTHVLRHQIKPSPIIQLKYQANQDVKVAIGHWLPGWIASIRHDASKDVDGRDEARP
jgi:hypothetical protein